MPIYEFHCQNCGRTFDKLVRSSAAVATIICPDCASPEVKKKLSVFSSHGTGGSKASTAASCGPTGL